MEEKPRARVTIIFADAIVQHGDNTYSLLRGGLDHGPPGGPIAVHVEVAFDPSEFGKRALALRVLDGNSEQVGEFLLSAPLTITAGTRIAKLDLRGPVFPPIVGDYQLIVDVDGHRIASYDFSIRDTPKPAT